MGEIGLKILLSWFWEPFEPGIPDKCHNAQRIWPSMSEAKNVKRIYIMTSEGFGNSLLKSWRHRSISKLSFEVWMKTMRYDVKNAASKWERCLQNWGLNDRMSPDSCKMSESGHGLFWVNKCFLDKVPNNSFLKGSREGSQKRPLSFAWCLTGGSWWWAWRGVEFYKHLNKELISTWWPLEESRLNWFSQVCPW